MGKKKDHHLTPKEEFENYFNEMTNHFVKFFEQMKKDEPELFEEMVKNFKEENNTK